MNAWATLDGGVDVGGGIGSDHPSEQRADESAGKFGVFSKGLEVFALIVAAFGAEQSSRRGGRGFGVVGVDGADLVGLVAQVFDLWKSKQ